MVNPSSGCIVVQPDKDWEIKVLRIHVSKIISNSCVLIWYFIFIAVSWSWRLSVAVELISDFKIYFDGNFHNQDLVAYYESCATYMMTDFICTVLLSPIRDHVIVIGVTCHQKRLTYRAPDLTPFCRFTFFMTSLY